MIIKSADEKQSQLDELNGFLALPNLSEKQHELISKEIHALKQGALGEKSSEYEINFYLKDSKNWAVIHDLRIEHNGRVAQIDHLLINRLLEIYVVETKNFSADLQINDEGEFTAWYNKRPIGIPSPQVQNEKHIQVLKELCKTLPLPTRLGVTLMPTFMSVIMLSNKQRITRPKKFDTKNIIKAEQILEWVTKTNTDNAGMGRIFGGLAKMISGETLMEIAELFVRHHRPIMPDYRTKFGIKIHETVDTQSVQDPITSEVSKVIQEVTPEENSKLTSSKLAAKLGVKNVQLLNEKLIENGLLTLVDGKPKLTDAGKAAGGEAKFSPKFGPYFIWPMDLVLQ